MADWLDLFNTGGFQAGAAGLGGAADIWAFVQNERQRQAMQRIRDILSNPRQLATYIAKFQQPMSQQAVAATNRDLGANWAVQTGGAPGGALNQYTADAFAKLETDRQNQATSAALNALSGAAGVQNPQMPMGNLQNILRSLMILKRIRGDQQGEGASQIPGITVPTPGGGGYGGGSESWRDQGPFPAPRTPGIPDDYSGAT